MDHLDASVVELMARERHHEDLLRGEASRRAAQVPGGRRLRIGLAAALLALAARLAPAELPESTAELRPAGAQPA